MGEVPENKKIEVVSCEVATYIEFHSPFGGSEFYDMAREVKDRNIANVKLLRDCYGFQFFDFLRIIVNVDGQEVRSEERIKGSTSPMHYYDAYFCTVQEAREMSTASVKKKRRFFLSGNRILFSMKSPEEKIIYFSRFREFCLPFDESGILVESSQTLGYGNPPTPNWLREVWKEQRAEKAKGGA